MPKREVIEIWGPEAGDRSLDAGSMERLNMYMSAIESGRGSIALYSMPGTKEWLDIRDNPIKGCVQVGDFLYAVIDDELLRVARDRSVLKVGTVDTFSDRVAMESNNLEVIIVAKGSAWLYTIASNSIVKLNSFPGYDSITYQGLRFLTEKDNKLYAGGINDGGFWPGANVATAESNADKILRLFAYKGIVNIFGERTIEFWQNTGGVPMPYSYVSTEQYGLAAVHSLAAGSVGVFGLFYTAVGQVIAGLVDNYKLTQISDPKQSLQLAKLNVAAAEGIVYSAGGHEFYQVTFTKDNISWIYDRTSDTWIKGQTFDRKFLDGRIAVSFDNKRLITSGLAGKIYEIELDTQNWAGVSTTKGFTSRTISFNNRYVLCYSFELEGEAGVGAIGDPEPTVTLEVSKDGGYSYSYKRTVKLGSRNRKIRLIWRALGGSREWTFRVRVSDSAKRVVFLRALAEFKIP